MQPTVGALYRLSLGRSALVNSDSGFLTFRTVGKSLIACSGYNHRLARWVGNWRSGLEVACDRSQATILFSQILNQLKI